MNIDISGFLDAGRDWAEALMVDQCVIRRQTGLVTDPVTGDVSPTYETVYPTAADIAAGNNGKCKVQAISNRVLAKDAAMHEYMIQRFDLDVPVSAVGIQPNDEAVIVVSPFDADLTGRAYRITGPASKSISTARRLGVEEN